MRTYAVALAVTLMLSGLILGACDQKKEAPKPTEQKATGEQAPGKKSPVGC